MTTSSRFQEHYTDALAVLKDLLNDSPEHREAIMRDIRTVEILIAGTPELVTADDLESLHSFMGELTC